MPSSKKQFTRILRDHVAARANLMQAVTKHPTLVGTGRERAVMDMLRSQLPRRYEVLTGTILGQSGEGGWQKDDRQLDVMVVDTFDYPTVLRDGDLAVVLPQAVRVVIEVKSNLTAPPDPDKAVKQGAAGHQEENLAGEELDAEDAEDEPNDPAESAAADADDADAPERSKFASGKRDTFLDAVQQVARNRSLFDDEVPALTILLSHWAPEGNKTLRRWLANVMKTRRKLEETLGGLDKGAKNHAKMKQQWARLDPLLLPDVIIAERGALAIKNGTSYEFFVTGKAEDSPGLVTLVWWVVEYLDRQDTMLGPSHPTWQGLRQRAKDLFRTVMEPATSADEDALRIDLENVQPNHDEGQPAPSAPAIADAPAEGIQ